MPKKPAPIFSSYADDPELRDDIDEFVIRLAERVDLVQDAEGAGDLVRLASLCTRLTGTATRLGFASLAEVAQGVVDAAGDDKPQIAQESVLILTRVAHGIRLGHRGAA